MGGLWAECADPVTVPYWAGSILPTLYLDAPTKRVHCNSDLLVYKDVFYGKPTLWTCK